MGLEGTVVKQHIRVNRKIKDIISLLKTEKISLHHLNEVQNKTSTRRKK